MEATEIYSSDVLWHLYPRSKWWEMCLDSLDEETKRPKISLFQLLTEFLPIVSHLHPSPAHTQEVILEPARVQNMVKAAGSQSHNIFIYSRAPTPSPSFLKVLRGRRGAMGLMFSHALI